MINIYLKVIISYLLLKNGGILAFDDYTFGITDRRPYDIPHHAINFFDTAFIDRGKVQRLGMNLMATYKKLE